MPADRVPKVVSVGRVKVGGGNPLVLIAGPCVIESESLALRVAGAIKKLSSRLSIPFIFKSSYDKANRTSINSFRGPGLEEGLRILRKVKEEIGVPVLSDVHSPEEAREAADVLDAIQIPAFLSRQTDLLKAAGRTGKPVNVKKGQFLAPWDIGRVVEKISSTGNRNILLTERGFSFGYNNLVADMRSLVVMRTFGYPVIFDASHSVQLPGGKGHSSGGEIQFIAPLARAASAVGIDGLFIEVHPSPERALSDGANSLRISDLPALLEQIKEISKVVSSGH